MIGTCPFCGGTLAVEDQGVPGTDIVYLRARCTVCREQIVAVGRGRPAADADLQRRIAWRRGTPPERWRIRPRPERRKGARR